MMRLLIIGALLVSLAVPAFALNYPAELPKDFKSAPKQLICGRETPTSLHQEFYFDPHQGWAVAIVGRNKKDLFVVFGYQTLTGKKAMKFILSPNAPNGWRKFENVNELTAEEFQVLGEAMFLTPEEDRFIAECRARAKKAD